MTPNARRSIAVPLGSFIAAAQTFADLLEQLDRQVSGRPQNTLDWIITNLELGSVTIEAEAQPRDDTLDVAPLVASRFVEGLALLERGAERPPDFTDEMLEASKKLVSLLNDGVNRVAVRSSGKQVTVSQHVAANVDTLIGPRHVSLGSVEGTLEAVSLHGRPTFNVYDRVHGRRIRCDFTLDMLDSVKDALGKRVLVKGTVRSNARGEPLSVRVEELHDYLVLIDVTRLTGELARKIVWEHGLRPADAIHVASTIYANVEVLQTLDDRLLRRNGQVQGLRIEKPRWVGQLQLPENP